jgi:hypothetical protein
MSKALLADRGLWAGAFGIGHYRPAGQRQQPTSVTGLTKSEAEDLLDWLDANGYREYHLSYSDANGFTVSFSRT